MVRVLLNPPTRTVADPAAVAPRINTAPHAALRSILEWTATTGTKLQQTAHRLVEATDSEWLLEFTSDFGSVGSP